MQGPKLSELYPKYYKPLPPGVDSSEVDTYVVNLMFPVEDSTGCILHARKKLLIPGVRSGGKSMLKDITEARDTLNRYIDLMSASDVTTSEAFTVDGWYGHSTDEPPATLLPATFVQVKLADGTQPGGRRRVSEWVWKQDNSSAAITHWRYAP